MVRVARILIVLVGGSWAGVLPSPLTGDEWPQWRGPNRDGVWRETGIVDKLPAGRIPLRWRAPIASGYTGPTVAGGRVFVMDRQVKPREVERVLCFDWQTGKPLWTDTYDCTYEVSYPAGPRASVSIDEGRAYALGTMGHLHCYNAADGKILWAHDLKEEYKARVPTWGIAAAPLVDGELVILQIGGSNGACLVALDKQPERHGERRQLVRQPPLKAL